MHYGHVKSKETQMKRNLKYPYPLDSEVIGILQARARRARSQAMGNLAVRLVQWLGARFSSNGRAPFGVKWG
jgi:hypothetical protein